MQVMVQVGYIIHIYTSEAFHGVGRRSGYTLVQKKQAEFREWDVNQGSDVTHSPHITEIELCGI